MAPPARRPASVRDGGAAEAGPRRRGADIAVALLALLVEGNGSVPVGTAIGRTGAPRSSLYRAAASLAAVGLLDLSKRGIIALGRRAADLATARDEVVRHDDERRLMRMPTRRLGALDIVPAFVRHADATAVVLPPATARRAASRVGFANAALDGPWRVALVHSVEYGGARHADRIASLAVRHADNDPVRQADDIMRLVADGADGLIVSAAAGSEVAEAIAEARRRGVPSVLVDRPPTGDAGPSPFVTSDDLIIGGMTALWLAEFIGGRGRVMLLPGLAGAEPAHMRLDGACAVLARFPGIEAAAVRWTGWRAAVAQDVIAAMLAAGETIDAVWCDSGLQAVGSLRAFIAGGGPIPPHTGGDLNLVYKLALRHRVPLAAMDYPPAMGLRSVELLIDLLRGRAVPRRIDVATGIVVTRGAATPSVQPHLFADEHVRWDLPDDLVLASGLGPAYDPRSFRVHYRGNRYNRSAAERRGGGAA